MNGFFFFRRSPGSTRVLNPLKVWDGEMNNSRALNLNLPDTDSVCIRSVCRNAQVEKKIVFLLINSIFFHIHQGKILVGLKTCDILEIEEKGSDFQITPLVCGHGEGQLWALSPHPTEPMFATGSYDRHLAVWNISTKVRLF